MKKKILFITEALWVGGIETALVNLLNGLNGEAYELTCLVLRNEIPMAARLPKDCRLLIGDRVQSSFPKPYPFVRLYHLTETPTSPSTLHRAFAFAVPALRWAENLLYICWLRCQLAPQRFDTAVIYSDAVAEVAARAVPADNFLLFYHHGALRKACHDEIAWRKSHKIIAVAQWQAQALRQFRPKYAHKITAIHNLLDAKTVRAQSEAEIPEVFSPEKTHIVTCGRIAPEKGMELAVQACRKLIQAGFDRIHWWIVGGGPGEAALQGQIRQLGLENHMTLTGMRDNPYPYIRRADVYVQPSRVEGYPMAILEALALERRVVATDTPGAREALRSGEDGLLCDVSADALAGSVENMLKTPCRAPLRRDWEQENQAALQALKQLL